METDKQLVLSEISEDEKKLVENQLEIILASTYFQSAKQMQRFLKYIVRKTLAGEGKFLKQYTIAIEALGFPDDFDSDSNPAIRIMAGRVRSRLKEFYDNSENYRIFIDIPVGVYCSNFYLGFQNQNNNDISNEDKQGYKSTGPRIALLSFTDKTESKESNRLLVQTTDVLAREFSRFVLFNLLVFNPYADKSKSNGLDSDLEVDYIFALYVQVLPDNQFELICRLSDNSSDEIVWSESYPLTDKSATIVHNNIIAKITASIADFHQGKLHPHWARGLLLDKENIPNKFKVMAYVRHYYDNFTIDTFSKAVSVCETALKYDANDIIANIMFSDLCRRDFVHDYNVLESPLKRGIESAERVTHLRQDSHEGHFTLGQLLFSNGEWNRSTHELNIAREITKTHAVIEYGCGFYFCLMGKWDEGINLVRKAIALSNSYPSWYHMPLFLYFYHHENYKEALMEAKKIVTPSIPHGPLARCVAYAQLGEIIKAKNELKELQLRIPELGNDGKNKLIRLLGNEVLVEKIWKDLTLVVKS